MMICDNLTVRDGVLYFAGQNTVELAQRYQTPLYLLDEDRIRSMCRMYRRILAKYFGGQAQPLYASKANCFRRMYEIMKEEGMGIDVVSCGEIYTALQAGFDLSKAYFHGNNKTDEDIAYAMEHGVGCFVADNEEEVRAVEAEAAKRGRKQKMLLRLTPGIDPHTYEAVATGKVDSKFGSAIETGQAERITALALQQPHIELLGYHCHVGSQVFGEDIFQRAAAIMLEFAAEMRHKLGFTASILDLGGGFGVRYTEEDPQPDVEQRIREMADTVKETCRRLNYPMPVIHVEPGRSIVADSGLTLYTVGTVKTIPGYKSYVSVDGSMADHIRFALYGSRYTCLPADRMDEPREFTASIAGRCCESGDMIQEGVPLPAGVKRGDLIAVCTTGAYHYSMASNYNRLPKPPVVMLSQGKSYVAVRRETFEDLCRNDV